METYRHSLAVGVLALIKPNVAASGTSLPPWQPRPSGNRFRLFRAGDASEQGGETKAE